MALIVKSFKLFLHPYLEPHFNIDFIDTHLPRTELNFGAGAMFEIGLVAVTYQLPRLVLWLKSQIAIAHESEKAEVRIFVFGSLVGGTGAALFPFMYGILNSCCKELGLIGRYYGCALTTTFYENILPVGEPEYGHPRNQRLSLKYLKEGLPFEYTAKPNWDEFLVAEAIGTNKPNGLVQGCTNELLSRWMQNESKYQPSDGIQFTDLNSIELLPIPSHPRIQHEQHAPKIFICYAREDESKAIQLYDVLSKNNCHPWIDKKNILAGDDWDRKIQEAIQESDFLIVCLSNTAITKRGYVQREIRFALDCFNEMPLGATFLIPARLEECLPPKEISRYHYVDLFAEDGAQYLIDSIIQHWVTK